MAVKDDDDDALRDLYAKLPTVDVVAINNDHRRTMERTDLPAGEMVEIARRHAELAMNELRRRGWN